MTTTMNIDVLIGEIAGESGGEIRPDAVRFCLSQLGSLVRDEVKEGWRVEVSSSAHSPVPPIGASPSTTRTIPHGDTLIMVKENSTWA